MMAKWPRYMVIEDTEITEDGGMNLRIRIRYWHPLFWWAFIPYYIREVIRVIREATL